MEQQQYQQFKDFSDEKALEGEKLKMDDILNKEILIKDFNIKKSRYSKNETGMYLMLQFELNGETKVLFTGSDVLIKQLQKYKEHIPFMAILKKINKYYTLS